MDLGGGQGGNTEKFVAAVNAVGLCGFTDWRMPTKVELQGIVDIKSSAYSVYINAAYFPNTEPTEYWSASPAAGIASAAWLVGFGSSGTDIAVPKSLFAYVRLVRGGQ